MFKAILTQYGEMVNYSNIITIKPNLNWDDAEVDGETGYINPVYEVLATDILGNNIQLGVFPTWEDAENAVKALFAWFSNEAHATYEVK